jgi:hypothetical protein
MPYLKQKSLALEQRRKQVAANVLAGLNYRDIAEGLGVSLGTVARDVKIMMDRMRKEQVQDVSEAALIDLRRIDVALNAIWEDVKNGKLLAIDRFERLLRRRAEMLGYDEKVFTLIVDGVIDINDLREKRWSDIEKLLAEMLADSEEKDDVKDSDSNPIETEDLEDLEDEETDADAD